MNTSPQRAPAGRWKQVAGAGAAVAVLIVAQATAAKASTASPPTATQTLSTGAYSWQVAASKGVGAATDQRDTAGPLHGEFPIVAADGTVQIRRWQWGEVAALSSDALTVVSDDGYTSDYRVGSGLGASADFDSVSVGELVTVVGTVEPAEEIAPA